MNKNRWMDSENLLMKFEMKKRPEMADIDADLTVCCCYCYSEEAVDSGVHTPEEELADEKKERRSDGKIDEGVENDKKESVVHGHSGKMMKKLRN